MKKNLLTLLSCAALSLVMMMGCKKNTTDMTDPTPVTPVTPVVVAPTLTAVMPVKALPNSAVSITGTNFTTDMTKITVTFNGVAATVYSATATEIVVGVPATAKTGNVVLVSNGTTLTSSTFTVTSGTQSTYATGYFEHIGIDGSGTVYGDGQTPTTGYASVNKFTSAGVLSVLAGGVAAANSPFKSLWGTAVDASGNVYVADQGKHQIDKITPAGVVSIFAGSGTAAYADGIGTTVSFLAGPFGLAIDASGNLYTNDRYRVRKITAAGVVTTLAGGDLAGYVDGAAGTALLGGSEGIAVDAAGNVYVDDNKSVRKITQAGVVTTLAGGGTAGFADGQGKAATFYGPQAMAIDAAGNVFVADNQYTSAGVVYAIRMVNKAGLVTSFMKNTYTLTTAPSNIVNGAIGTATTNFPDGITFDAAGNMYIANTGVASTGLFSNTVYNGAVSKIIFQ